ncbi:MAG: transposase [Gemmatimonadales bacterium]|nr:transposase [Gemmatimonadales bacterium]
MDDETSRRVLTEFKQEAVRQINEVGRPVSRVARDLDLRHEQLLTWPKQLAATEDAPPPVETLAEARRGPGEVCRDSSP